MCVVRIVRITILAHAMMVGFKAAGFLQRVPQYSGLLINNLTPS
jgi:hypothetical protein